MLEIWIQSLDEKDPLEKEMAAPSSTLAWEIPWTEEPQVLQSTESPVLGHNLVTKSPPHHSIPITGSSLD